MGVQRFTPESQCYGKKAYAKKSAAKQAVKRGEQAFGERMHPYRCPHCAGWHIGHPPPRELRQPA